jgi:hypothetical protein
MKGVDDRPSVMLMVLCLANALWLPLELRTRCLRFAIWLREKAPPLLDELLLSLPADRRFTVEDLLLTYVRAPLPGMCLYSLCQQVQLPLPPWL